jgi:zinc transporter, ZIP family
MRAYPEESTTRVNRVAEELIPEAKRGSPDIAALALIVGFAVMMILDVALA